MGVLNTLMTRALSVSDKDHIDSEKEHLYNVFLGNGYRPTQINKSLKITKAHKNILKDSFKEKKVGDHKAFLPYIQGIKDKIAKHLEDMQGLAQVDNWPRRRTREAIEIVKNLSCLNKDIDLTISRSWLPELTKLNKN